MIVDEQAEPAQSIEPIPAGACRRRVDFCAPERRPLLQQHLSRRSLLKTAGWLTALDSMVAARGALARDELNELGSPSLARIDAAFRDATRARLVPGIVAMAASKPARTCGAPSAGSMSGTGSSSLSLPCSTSC